MFELRNPDLQDIPALRRLWREAFGDSDAFLDAFFQTAFAPARSLVAAVDKEIAAALFWFFCDYEQGKLAYLYGVCTGAAYRGQGFCHKLMAAAEKTLAAKGCVGTILVPGNEKLVSLYASMGHAPCCPVQEQRVFREKTPLAIAPVTPEEYAALRQNLLPPGGVRQEGASLAFQARLGNLYRVEHCIFAAEPLGSSRVILKELLTDGVPPEKLAGRILAFLQADEGILRCSSAEGKNFAMFRPLKPCQPPAYFGLAFD